MTFGLIRRSYKFLNEYTFKKLFVALVRPHVEYAQAVWSPYYIRDIEQVENVQRRATRQIPSLRNMTYTQRLERLKLPTLKYRRYRGDMIETYKIMSEQNLYDTKVANMLKLKENEVLTTKPDRVHNKMLYDKNTPKKVIRINNFVNRIRKPWNELHQHVVNSPSLNTFKNRLDTWWSTQSMLYD